MYWLLTNFKRFNIIHYYLFKIFIFQNLFSIHQQYLKSLLAALTINKAVLRIACTNQKRFESTGSFIIDIRRLKKVLTPLPLCHNKMTVLLKTLFKWNKCVRDVIYEQPLISFFLCEPFFLGKENKFKSCENLKILIIIERTVGNILN